MISIRIYAAVVVFASLHTPLALARQWYYQPQIFVNAGYSENPTLRSDDFEETVLDGLSRTEFRDQGFGILGSEIRFVSETEDNQFTLDLNAIGRRYTDTALDSELLSAISGYEKLTELSTFSLDAGLSRDSSFTRELEDTGRIQTDVTTQELLLDSNYSTQLSQKLQGELEISYADVNYENSDSSLVDFETVELSLGLDRTISTRLSILAEVGYLAYQPNSDVATGGLDEESAIDFLIGFEYLINPIDRLYASFGSSERDSTVVNADGTMETTSRNGIYRIEFEHIDQQNTLSVGLENSFEGTGAGGLSETQRLILGFDRSISEQTTFNISAIYFNRIPVQDDMEEREYFEIIPGISWQATRFVSLTFDVGYREQTLTDSGLNTMSKADSTSFEIGARYDWGRKLIKQ